jgi:putative ABC transport system permease protein
VSADTAPADDPGVPTHYRFATPGYFRVMQIPVYRGRVFDGRDTPTSPPVVVVNESLARQLWKNEDPIGKYVRLKDRTREVIGVAGDCRHLRPDLPSGAEIYVPRSQVPGYLTTFLAVRTAGDASGLAEAVRGAIWAVDRNQPVADLCSMDERLGRYTAVRRVYTGVLGLFAVVALAVSGVGVYGVMAYSVSQRRHEIAVRMALGARPGEVTRMVMRQGVRLAAAGLVTGLAGALAVTRALSSLLYEVRPSDPLTLLLVSAVLSVVALAACAIPARRATRIDPMLVLRGE